MVESTPDFRDAVLKDAQENIAVFKKWLESRAAAAETSSYPAWVRSVRKVQQLLALLEEAVESKAAVRTIVGLVTELSDSVGAVDNRHSGDAMQGMFDYTVSRAGWKRVLNPQETRYELKSPTEQLLMHLEAAHKVLETAQVDMTMDEYKQAAGLIANIDKKMERVTRWSEPEVDEKEAKAAER